MKQPVKKARHCRYVILFITVLMIVGSLPVVMAREVSTENTVVRVFSNLSFTLPLALVQAPDDAGRWYAHGNGINLGMTIADVEMVDGIEVPHWVYTVDGVPAGL